MHARSPRPLALLAALAVLAAGCMNEEERRPVSSTPAIQLSATELTFRSLTNATSPPAAQLVTVTNFGGGTLAVPARTVTTTSGGAWLTAEVSGTAVPYTVTVRAALGALTAGTYLGEVRLESPGAVRVRTIPVTFVVTDPRPPDMVLSRAVLDFAGLVGGASPPAQVVTVTNGGDLPLERPAVSVTVNTPWLTAAVTGTAPPYTVTVSVDTTGLAADPPVPLGGITLTAAGAASKLIAVNLEMSAPRTVTATRLVTFWTEAGPGAGVPDANLASVAFKQDDGAGGLTTFPATAGAGGTWTASIGPGDYWAVMTFTDQTQSWIRAGGATLDLGDAVAGRPDREAATLPTPATLAAPAFFPWDTLSDSLWLTSFGAGSFATLRVGGTPPLDVVDGQEDLTGVVVPWADTFRVLLAPTDQLWLTQLRSQASPGSTTLFYDQAEAWSRLDTVSMTDGVAVTLTAPAAEIPALPGSLLLDWRRSQFENALPATPAADPAVHGVAIVGMPFPLDAVAPLAGFGPPLLVTAAPRTSTGDGDFSAGSLPYFGYLPTGWSALFAATYEANVSRVAPGATGGAPGLKNGAFLYQAADLAPNPVAPLLASPSSPTIGGLDALVARTGVSATPTLAWGAPDTGTATSYQVFIIQLTAGGTGGTETVATGVALFTQPAQAATTLTIPPGVLQPGRAYAALLVARSNPAEAGGAAPFRFRLPYAEARYWTEVFTVAP